MQSVSIGGGWSILAARQTEDKKTADTVTTRVRKVPISAPHVLNEAYQYDNPVPFTRGMRVEMGPVMMLFISGTASVNEDGESIHLGDVEQQSWRTFRNIKALLESEGASWHDVVRTTCYLKDMRDYDRFNKVRNAFYQQEGLNPYPASTAIEAGICRPELLVEIEAIAVVPGPDTG